MAHREEIISMLENYKDVTLRIVLRNSSYYEQILGRLHMQDNLCSEENRQDLLNKLKLHGKEFSSTVIEHEKKCLLEGEIPYFCVGLDGKALCGDDTKDILQENYFKDSALSYAKFRLNRLSRAEKIFEEQYISRRFKHAPLDESVSDIQPTTFKEIDSPKNSYCAQNIFDELNNDAIHTTDGTIAWFSELLSQRVKPSCELMTPQAKAAQIELWEESDAEVTRKLPIGIYDGIGGIISTCVELGDEKNFATYLKANRREKNLRRRVHEYC